MIQPLNRELRLRDCLPFAYTYAGLLFVCTSLGVGTQTVPFILGGFITVLGTMELCAVFAGVGPHAFWRRAVSALLLGGVVAAGGVIGLVLGISLSSLDDNANILEFLAFAAPIAFFYWGISLLPNLLFRFIWGWSIGLYPSRERFGISDIFTYTTIVAVGVAALQTVTWLFPSEQSFWGTIPILVIGAISIHALLSLPIYFLALSKAKESAFGFTASYVGAMGLLLFFLAMSFRTPPGLAMILAMLCPAYGCLFGLPVLMLREYGVQLWTRNSTAAYWQDEPTDEPIDSATPSPDPFAEDAEIDGALP